MAFDLPIGALTVYCEASNQTPEVRRCIASVLMNRLHDGRWGHTLAAVCLKRMQFSEWDADPVDNANLERGASTPDGDPIMQDCQNAMEDALSGNLLDLTEGALFYHDSSIPNPWPTMKSLGQKGRFFFYTDK